MKLFVRIFVFFAAFLFSICFYHASTYKTQSEILLLTKDFQAAYKNQDYEFLNKILTDDVIITSSEHNDVNNKLDLREGLKTYETDEVRISSIEVTPIWIQADRAKPTITFDTKAVILFAGKPSICYGQYTFTFDKRKADWQILSINFDINYQGNKPH